MLLAVGAGFCFVLLLLREMFFAAVGAEGS